jgi:hypothetical protein
MRTDRIPAMCVDDLRGARDRVFPPDATPGTATDWNAAFDAKFITYVATDSAS